MSHQSKHGKLPIINPQGTDSEMLATLQKETFEYFLKETNSTTGLIADNTAPNAPSSIAAVGMALSCYVTGVERGYISRVKAAGRIHTVLNFLYTAKQGPEVDATGYKGFYYHFLDMETGKRTWDSELSTIDTAIFMAGVLTAQGYFNSTDEIEHRIRHLADKLYRRIDWQWAMNGGNAITHGWKPGSGFLSFHWDSGYSEAHILYVLALASPTFPIDSTAYRNWTATFECKEIYGTECIYAGPLFIHQMSQLWLDFRDIKDDVNNKTGIDYFENSARATSIQQQYAIKNPLEFEQYGEHNWGFTASDGPGPCTLTVDGIERNFYNYTARGVPYGPDDGTISPWAVVASLPFAPKIVLSTIRHAIERLDLKKTDHYGFDASFNPTFPEHDNNPNDWVSLWQFGLNQGPIVLMIENYNNGLIWDIMKTCPYVVKGLKLAGFTGGWLDKVKDQ